MAACIVEPTEIDFCRRRGATYSIEFTVREEPDDDGTPGAVIDITGFAFILTVDPSECPPDDTTKLFDIVGVLDGDPTTGKFTITPLTADADQDPDTYFYDVRQTDAGGAIRFLAVGEWKIIESISK